MPAHVHDAIISELSLNKENPHAEVMKQVEEWLDVLQVVLLIKCNN